MFLLFPFPLQKLYLYTLPVSSFIALFCESASVFIHSNHPEWSEEIFPVDEMMPDVKAEGWSRVMDRTATPRPAAESLHTSWPLNQC